MEDGLIIGYDLCKDFCRISYYEEGQEEPQDLIFTDEANPYLIQNSICKKKGQDQWLIGEEAYETALLGDGAIVDKLLRLVSRNGFSTFEGIRYSAEELLLHFFDETLKVLYKEQKTDRVAKIMFSVQELDSMVLDAIIRCMKTLGIDRQKVRIISHTESYLYYVLSQKRDLWSNMSVLYDLSGDGLNYYELEILRGMQPNVAEARRTFLEEGFSPDILESPSGQRMADNIMTSCVDRMLSKKIVSSVYLSGKGMDSCRQWGENFLKTVCQRRRVFLVENLFAKGAVYAAMENLREKSIYPFSIMCEGRINVDISMDVYSGVNSASLNLARAGSNWYETKKEFDIIPDQENTLKIRVKKPAERQSAVLEIPLSDFLKRGNKLCRIGVSLSFTSDNTFSVVLQDKGFGEIFPPGGAFVKKTFTIE